MQFVREASPDPERQLLLRRALLITILGNVALGAGKGIAAYFSDSVALYADAANSISDVFYSLLMTLGMWMALRPPDITHPQGHSRFEPLAGIVVAAAMTFAGYEAGRTAIVRFLEGGERITLGLPTVVLVLSAGVKAGMYAIIRRIATSTRNSTLDAAATDNLSDVLTSLAAFLGTLGTRFVHPVTDPLAGALVTIWIFRSAYGVWRDNLRYLTGGGAPTELRDRIIEVAWSVNGVVNVHQVLTEYIGPDLVADLHINVDGHIPLFDAHAISDQVRERIEALAGIDRAYVHVEPCETIPRREEDLPGSPLDPPPDAV